MEIIDDSVGSSPLRAARRSSAPFTFHHHQDNNQSMPVQQTHSHNIVSFDGEMAAATTRNMNTHKMNVPSITLAAVRSIRQSQPHRSHGRSQRPAALLLLFFLQLLLLLPRPGRRLGLLLLLLLQRVLFALPLAAPDALGREALVPEGGPRPKVLFESERDIW